MWFGGIEKIKHGEIYKHYQFMAKEFHDFCGEMLISKT